MKKFAMICLFATLAWVASAQNTEPAHGAKIRFEELEHQYGTIQKGGNGDCQFKFWNDGDEPLILQTVKASCGCTTPKYTQKPVMPGQQGVIDVHYNTNNPGGFSKTVTVTSNAVNNQRVVLRIKGTVVQDSKPEVKPQPKPEVKPEVDPEIKPAAKPEMKAIAKPEVKSDMKVKTKLEQKPVMATDEAKAPVKTKLTPEQQKTIVVLNESLKKNKMDLNASEIKPSDETIEAIKHMVEEMNEDAELHVSITGHTCNTGSSETNMHVGMKRAEAAKELLVSYGVPADRIEVFSKGDKEPAYSNDTEEGRMKNRRVEIEYVK
ncbi:MAG: DUF1573 domain-containing protein [Bacteroidales bacterium]|nr:DUF1573 domain-containing protein [Bacteroidales bacterium]